jgi:hypothetical protein
MAEIVCRRKLEEKSKNREAIVWLARNVKITVPEEAIGDRLSFRPPSR